MSQIAQQPQGQQGALFDLPPCEITKPRKLAPQRGRAQPEPEELKLTLFGLEETKLAANKRAKRISNLITEIQDAPQLIAWREADIQTLGYFIEKSRKVQLSPNDLDGLHRFVDMSDLLTDADRKQMKRRKVWRRLPKGWPGAKPRDTYPAALHNKEVRHLRDLQKFCKEEIELATEELKQNQSELERLRKVCPLPKDIAEQHQLTSAGYRLEPSRKKTS